MSQSYIKPTVTLIELRAETASCTCHEVSVSPASINTATGCNYSFGGICGCTLLTSSACP
jgi:hypothetical protein